MSIIVRRLKRDVEMENGTPEKRPLKWLPKCDQYRARNQILPDKKPSIWPYENKWHARARNICHIT